MDATTSPGSREIETERKTFSSAGTDHGSLDRGILRTAKLGGNALAVLLMDRGARPPRVVASGSVLTFGYVPSWYQALYTNTV